jgi:hypothetical protein
MQEKPRSYLASEIRASAAAKKWWRGQICDDGIFMMVFCWNVWSKRSRVNGRLVRRAIGFLWKEIRAQLTSMLSYPDAE